MAFREIVAPTVKELFIQQLEGMILSGELRPGDRLPTERELADEMKISKTVVHEGLRELHRLGFLDIASRRGVTVADYAQTGSLETLRAIMDFHGGLPDAKTAGSILQLRYYLEGPAMEELAARHTPADMAALQALQRQAEQAAQDVAATLVTGKDAVRDHKVDSTGVVGDDAQGAAGTGVIVGVIGLAAADTFAVFYVFHGGSPYLK